MDSLRVLIVNFHYKILKFSFRKMFFIFKVQKP